MNDRANQEVLLFNQALVLPPIARADYLKEACSGDPQLHGRLTALLEAHERAGAFLQDRADQQAKSSIAMATSANGQSGEMCGDYVGRYKLLQQIGEGGCGVVYMAEQQEPVHRRVALKVIKLGMDTREVIARFEAERQALAMMDHPNIAKVFDAGATDTGRPYFVMDLVRGVKITDFCDENKVSTEERLRLFIEICHSIQHAHQKGIIHRDIKPTNILVPMNDGLPVPKVIDFGIAKATQGKLTDQTLFTAFEQFIGTPAYMSPEQAVMTNVEVDTRSDIYSLGVLLYELLTGHTPFAQKELLSSGLDEMRRTIREKDPVRPSTRLKSMAPNELTTVAKNRGSQPPQLIHFVRGDLDWIVMKCLQKDRARRYETVNGLAMDIERHLRDQPVLARPDSQAYRAAKFVRRHRASVTFAGLILLALVGGLTGTMTQARRATKHAALEQAERRRADEQARLATQQRDFALRQLSRAEAINDLNSFLLSDAAPAEKSFTVGELLARAQRVVEQQVGDSPDNRIELLIAVGHQYENLDEHGKARELVGKAYQLSRQLSEPSIRAKAAAALSVPVALAGECKRGEGLIQEALRELGDAPQFVLHRVFALLRGSRVARECGEEKLGVARVQIAERILRQSNQSSPLLNVTIAMDLAEAYRMAGQKREAADAFAAAHQQLSALGRADTEKAGTLLNNWGLALEGLGQPLEAERLYRQAVAISSANGKSPDAVSPMLLDNLAGALFELHRYSEAERYAEQAYEKAQQSGDEHVINLCQNLRSSIYREEEKLDLAAQTLSAFEAKSKQLLPADHPFFSAIASQKSLLALARGDLVTAGAEADRSIALAEAKPGVPMPWLLLRRARVHLGCGQYDAAKADALHALTLNEQAIGPEIHSSWSGRAHLLVGRALHAQGRLDEARAAYASAVKHLEPSLGKEHPETMEAMKGANL